MPFFQPPVQPLPPTTSFKGKTAIVTGANSGIGLATARELLRRGCKTLVLACRNAARAEQARARLLREVPDADPQGVQVKILDLDTYASVSAFTEEIRRDVPVVDLLVLNAGVAFFPSYTVSRQGHERTVQVMYLSTVFLLLSMLPHLEASRVRSGNTPRVTWVGSRKSYTETISQAPILPALDDQAMYSYMARYGLVKHLCLAFFYELAARLPADKLVVNMLCPGAIVTDLGRNLPFHYRIILPIHNLRCRSPEEAAWLVLNAGIVVGKDSHGKFFGDTKVEPIFPYFETAAGKEFKQKLWQETMAEMIKETAVPPELL
ncbi:hypothetical protein ASPZODRAFT_74057 [Penicilliopsis zonata CBS 506.65]|uniref:Short-chain dehydrogenase/reductase family protein n=1 Tax=Penicilliopsis zonata CBS 506.65 TaxID=1073090 RepID=A0A1L9S900_9EURO|nr:hypothetical protein ASPZODRAFT_74057 [Penicilliopsis zonata CBS 506.65]OJJ43641.1 hypothetical protein ASPZODRAFT_74057 [Penicilliopsis zonata CBS 506.65]